uniref:Aminotransferase-like plant mobile domain-containing protein n=1 Tax=Fagus sylvatica TaxID=28930 RepID=A0A2N9GJ14_FAGSY
MVPRELWYCHVAVLSFHASSSSNPPRFPCAYPFLTRFSGAVLEVFRNSKWVMQHIVGKLSTSSFQRYKVFTNRSSDEGVMAPGSRGVGAVFVHFSDEDSGQTGDAIGEPRVPRRSWSRYLSNAPGLADQLVASRKDSAREGGSCAAYFCKVPGFAEIRAWTCEIWPREQRPPEALHRGELGFARYDLANGGRRNVPYAKGFDHNSLVSRPFSTRKVRNRSSHHVLSELVKEVVSSIPVFGLVNGPVKPWSNLVNLGQTWSNLVKALQTLGNVSRTAFRRVFGHSGPQSGQKRSGQTLVKLRSTLVKLGRENVSRTFFLGVFDVASPRRIRPASVRAVSFCVPTPEKIPWSFPGPNGHSRVWRRSVGMRKERTLIDDQSSPIRPIAANRVVSTVWNLSPNRLRGDLTWGLPKLQIGWFNGLESQSKHVEGCKSGGSTVWNLSPNRLRGDLTWGLPKLQIGWFNGLESQSKQVEEWQWGPSPVRSPCERQGKAVVYAPESSPDTDDEYDAMEDVRTRFDASIARNLQAELDAEATGPASSAARPPPRPGVVIGRSARPSGTTHPSPQPRGRGLRGFLILQAPFPRITLRRDSDILPRVGIRPRYPVAVEISNTPPSDEPPCSSVFSGSAAEPPESVGRGGWSEFSRLLAVSRPEYREFLTELGFGPFLGIPYVSVYHPSVGCFVERFFHHTGTFHLSTCEMAVLPVDWSAILGIHFGEGSRRPSVRIRYLADILRRDREEPPTELRYRQWAAYFIFSCFLGNDKSTVPTPIVGMFRDIDALREYDWGTLTYGFYIRGLRRYSRRESISFLGFWQFTIFWAFEHFPTFAPSRLPLASDPDFPLPRRWDSSRIRRMTTRTLLKLHMAVDCIRDAEIVFQPYSAALTQRPEVFRAVELSHLRMWIRTPRSWELLLGERTLRQLGDEAVVPVHPSPLMTIEDYIPRAPSDPYVAGVSAYPSLVREDVPYQEWFERVSLGSLMSLHEVEGGRVMGGVAMDSHHIRSSGQIERLHSEILSLQLKLSVSEDRHRAEMQADLVQRQRDLDSRDAEVARLTAAVLRLEEQLQGMGITPVTGAGPSGFGRTSSPPPTDPVSRDWFFDDPPSI